MSQNGHASVPAVLRRGMYLDLGWFYIVFAAFTIVAFGNAVNLTDGLDGLATMPVIIASVAFMVIVYLVGNVKFADYLGIPHVPRRGRSGDLLRRDRRRGARVPVVQCAAGGGVHGRYRQPRAGRRARRRSRSSRITRSCWGSSAGCSWSRRCRVIIQVFFYKRTGKRVFRMAPIHHHFEQLGWTEPTVVIRFWIIALVLALAGLSTLKLR